MRYLKLTLFSVATYAILSATGCGGGGSSDSTVTATSTAPTIPPPPTPPPTPAIPHHLYTLDVISNSLVEYKTSASGSLSLISSALPLPSSTSVGSLTIDPTGKYAYATNGAKCGAVGYGCSAIYQYKIASNGSLIPMAIPFVSDVNAPSGYYTNVSIDPTGKFAYIGGTSNVIYVYSIGLDGSLSLASKTLLSVRTSASVNAIAVNQNNGHIYAVTSATTSVVTPAPLASRVFEFKNDSNGTLIEVASAFSALSPQNVYDLFNIATNIQIDSAGKYCYITTYGENSKRAYISEYLIGLDGALTPNPVQSLSVSNSKISIALEPSGKYAYVLLMPSGQIMQYTVGSTGSLTPLSTKYAFATNPASSIVADPSGGYVYVGQATGSIETLTIGSNGGLFSSNTAVTVNPPTAYGVSPYSVPFLTIF